MTSFFRAANWDVEYVNLSLARRIRVESKDGGYVVQALLPVSEPANGDMSAYQWVILSPTHQQQREAIDEMNRIVSSL